MSARCPHCGGTLEIRKSPQTVFDHDQALALLRFGATQKEVAELFGVSRQRIHQLAVKEGVA